MQAETTIGWLRTRLFSSWGNTILSLLGLWLSVRVIYGAIDWALLSAVFNGEDGRACQAPEAGACWPFIKAKFGLSMFGRYPDAERWRVIATYALAMGGLVPLMRWASPYKREALIYLFAVFPLLAVLLLSGGWFGLPKVKTELWGGLLVTLVVASAGIAASFPLGIALALGRRSQLPIVRWLSTGYIEIIRGVPLITILFMASVMLPLFLPPDASLDKLLRALIGVALFSAAYLAEVIRGGLQAIPRGQYEAADALGLPYWNKMGLIILPQALRLVIPGLVNSFISLFKDTSLVMIIGMFDLLGIVQQSVQSDTKWFSPHTAMTGYVFAGVIFWAFSFAMSRYSARLEQRLHDGAR